MKERNPTPAAIMFSVTVGAFPETPVQILQRYPLETRLVLAPTMLNRGLAKPLDTGPIKIENASRWLNSLPQQFYPYFPFDQDYTPYDPQEYLDLASLVVFCGRQDLWDSLSSRFLDFVNDVRVQNEAVGRHINHDNGDWIEHHIYRYILNQAQSILNDDATHKLLALTLQYADKMLDLQTQVDGKAKYILMAMKAYNALGRLDERNKLFHDLVVMSNANPNLLRGRTPFHRYYDQALALVEPEVKMSDVVYERAVWQARYERE